MYCLRLMLKATLLEIGVSCFWEMRLELVSKQKHFSMLKQKKLLFFIIYWFILYILAQKKQYFENPGRCGVAISPGVARPCSRGTITLASADPLDRPLIDPKLLEHPQDRHVMKAGKVLPLLTQFLVGTKVHP